MRQCPLPHSHLMWEAAKGMTDQSPLLELDNRFVRELDGLYVPWRPLAAPAPRWLQFNAPLAEQLGLDCARLKGDEGLAILSGRVVPEGAQPVAQAYAGHQFGGFSPQLGDGRALLLGEIRDREGRLHDIALKGSGPTPFSRGGDGKAAIGPVLREFLIAEAMNALGIPTTRALAALATGETIYRERPVAGALLVRIAASHVRVGTFEFLAARRDREGLKRLADHVIARHYPAAFDSPHPALALLIAVVERQAELLARWMAVGFIHGVMNTDNMTLSGETIDYGPCAFIEAHDPDTVYSSIDRQGRYAFGRQPGIAQWNLARLAEALVPLIDETPERALALASEAVNAFPECYQRYRLAVMCPKLGLDRTGNAAEDRALIDDYLALLQRDRVDHTLGFRLLSGVLRGDAQPLLDRFADGRSELAHWLDRWRARLQRDGGSFESIATGLDAVNPLVIARNHRVEEVLAAAAERDDLQPFESLLAAVRRPFDASLAGTVWAEPAHPEQAAEHRTFCGT